MGAILFVNVSIIDGSGEPAFAGDVRVEGNRIVAVARQPGSLAAGDALIVDGGGATLMPGLTDAHAHISFIDSADLAGLGQRAQRRVLRLKPRRGGWQLELHSILVKSLIHRRAGRAPGPLRPSLPRRQPQQRPLLAFAQEIRIADPLGPPSAAAGPKALAVAQLFVFVTREADTRMFLAPRGRIVKRM